MITEQQIKERVLGIGGSDCAAVLGLSRWKTPLQVWAEKTGSVQQEDISDRLPIEIGNELEDVVARLFTKRTGKQLRRVNETQTHKDYPFIRCNLDRRIVGEDAIFEAKTASAWKAKEWEGEDVPQEYVLQCLHMLAVTGAKSCYIAVLLGGNHSFVWKQIDRNEAFIADIIRREVEFWTKFVEPKIMPQVVKSGDSETLFKLFPKDQGAAIALGSDAEAICKSIKADQAVLETLKESIEANQNALKLMLGENTTGELPSFKVTWKLQAGSTYTVNKKPTRVLRIAEIEKEKK